MGELLFRIIKTTVNALSPELRQVLTNVYASLKTAANATDSLWDNLFVDVLGVLLGIEE